MIELKDHQKKPIEFMKYNRGVILYHSTGSGKTLTALYAVYQFKYDIIIIGTKSSKKTFIDNIQKANMDASRFTFYTYTKIKKILETNITIFRNTSVIVDEAHAIRNENMYNLYIASALMVASKIVLLTATPVINYFNDLSVLVNIVKGEDALPTERKLFDQMFYDDERMVLINENILFDKIKNTISYFKINDDENYPKSTTHYLEIEMSHEQIDEYIYYIRKIIYEDKDIVSGVDILNIDYGLLPNKKRNFFLNVTRQLSNTVKNSEDSPKIKEIFKKIEEGPYPIIVYSNFLKSGIYTLAILLEKNKINYKTITGFTTNDKLNVIVNNYNNGMYKVLLISSAGSESLDLKNTRQIHIMEPHWNESRIQQVIGRAIRYKSHENLPLEQRHVDIYRWVSIFPKQIKNLSADQYLIKLSQKKKQLWDKYQEIIKSASIENNFMAETKKNNKSKVNSKYIKNANDQYYDKYLKYKRKYNILKKNFINSS
ncbi:putative ATP-dependent RNA helicase [Tupanvirus soda lake]|uniref:ATP-dependent RNA helicase n=2 Tax=Tupanvirus TaxID=2094720 RepID=A0AC62AB03_9VIRU|nr:putative ATP-dependent RNA helicase [Tupanvirus soda lake]QKU34956.1 putative ATP-dependent RNA helicase [Tupanvirus soda lake]